MKNLKYIFICSIIFNSVLFLGACSNNNETEKNEQSTNVSINTEIKEDIIIEEEQRDPYTYKQFKETYYSNVPEEIAKLYIFVDTVRLVKNVNFTDKYYHYFEYQGLEDVISSYYNIIGCTYTKEMVSKIANFYKENNQEQFLCQKIYKYLNSDGSEDLSLLIDTYELSKEEENEYFIELYPYTYQSNSSDLLKLDADKTHMTLYLNNEKYDAYGIKSNYDNSKYIYVLFLPKNIILTKDNTGIIFQDKENNIQSCYTIDEIKQKIKDCYATVLSYSIHETREKYINNSIIKSYEQWVTDNNKYILLADGEGFYKSLPSGQTITFPIYEKENRKYSLYDYLMDLPNMKRTDENNIPTDYSIGLEDLFKTATK